MAPPNDPNGAEEEWRCKCGSKWPAKRKRCSCMLFRGGRNPHKNKKKTSAGAGTKTARARGRDASVGAEKDSKSPVDDVVEVTPAKASGRLSNEGVGAQPPQDVSCELVDAKEQGKGSSSSKKKKKKKPKKKGGAEEEATLEFTWICAECKEAECLESPDAPLLLCDGKCNRPFHPPCANLLASDVPPDDEPWHCADCVAGRHQCAVCKEYGEDDVDVFCCEAKGCGLFFHEHCLTMYNVSVQIVEEVVPDTDAEDGFLVGEGDRQQQRTKVVSRPKFRCPAHKCWTCDDGDVPGLATEDESAKARSLDSKSPSSGGKRGRKVDKRRKKSSGITSAMWAAKKERLFRCLECPISYHITCMPPSCKFHELAMLCHEHAYTSKLPYLDAEYSFQAGVEADAEKKVERMKMVAAAKASGEPMDSGDDDEGMGEMDEVEENPFLPGLVGSFALLEENQLVDYLGKEDEKKDGELTSRKRKKTIPFNYCLPCDLKEEVHSKPPSYNHVNVNRYNPNNKPKRHPPSGESCQCKPSKEDDGKSCDNRCLNRLSYVECVGDKSLKSGEKNPYWNCNCGPACGNRTMSTRQFAKCRPMREHGKGWGLIAINGVKKGDLVQEYAGEIIDEKTKEERLRAWSRDHPGDPNFYVMHLEPGWYIDAREVANMARFINHSCDPNCRLVPINVAGHMRVAIICIKDVAPGGFLCYDYQFDTQHGEKFTCRCGAKNCRGTMKGGKTDEDVKVSKKTKAQLFAEAKTRVQRDKKFLQSVLDSEKERCHLTGPFVPGGDMEKAEMVAGGPKERYRREAQEGRIFLWRNAVIGGDFSSRYWKTLAHNGREKKTSPPLTTLCGQLGSWDVISTLEG